MRQAPSARSIAADVLVRVARDGAWAAAALAAELERHPQLDRRERALATELVYGVLRTRGALLARISRHVKKGVRPREYEVIAHLLVAAYQLLLLDRTPAFAAVDHAVEAIARLRGRNVGGFANAVLRKLAASGEHLDYHAAVLESAPLWLRERITNSLGAAEMAALLGADARGGPAIALRLVKEPDPELLEQSEPGRASSRARLLKGQGDPRALPGYRDGKFVVQEEGAQLIALSLGARPGERILDACAGRGQKTSLLAEQIGGATLHAADCHPAKLGRLRDEFRRLGLAEPQVSAVDWTVGPGGVPGGFDRVLVDAPCTGVGTVRRRPELLGRLEPHDPSRLGALSLSVLRGAASRARSGGRVVFAVCSVFEEECEAVMAEVADLLEPAPIDVPEVDALVGRGATFGRLLPGRHGTDGYFIASFVRR